MGQQVVAGCCSLFKSEDEVEEHVTRACFRSPHVEGIVINPRSIMRMLLIEHVEEEEVPSPF